MSSVAEQHSDWIVGVKISHPQLNDGKPTVYEFSAPERQRDKNGDLIDLSPVEKIHQKIHGSIVRLFKDPSTGYTATGYKWLNETTIPELSRVHGVELTFKDNLRFRIVKVNADGKIYDSSGTFNPATGEWDGGSDKSPWLTYERFMMGYKDMATSALYTTTNKVETPKAEPVESEPVELTFLKSASILKGKASKKKAR
jgi:hypothetical protein